MEQVMQVRTSVDPKELTASGADRPDPRSPVVASRNRLKMASFAMNCQRGSAPTEAEGSIAFLDWAQQVRIARATEAAGLEAIIPVARWRGSPGPSHFLRESYETLPWAAAIAAVTERIAVFSTVHVPLVHPIRAAKEMVTIDHVSGGRFGLNIVCGWNSAEFAMFGRRQLAHEDRYAQGGEWADLVKRLWRETDPFDWQGKYYQGEGLVSEPRPLQNRPVIMSAGASPTGRDFAGRHADINFITAFNDLAQLRAAVAGIKDGAARHGRQVEVWLYAGMLCAPTEAEVKRRYDYFVHEKGDWTAAEHVIRLGMEGGAQSMDLELSRAMQERLIAFFGAHRFMGTPEQIVEQLAEVSAAGVDGLALTWIDYEEGLANFTSEILPLAVDAGLRRQLTKEWSW